MGCFFNAQLYLSEAQGFPPNSEEPAHPGVGPTTNEAGLGGTLRARPIPPSPHERRAIAVDMEKAGVGLAPEAACFTATRQPAPGK